MGHGGGGLGLKEKGGSVAPPPDLDSGVMQLVWTSKGGGTTEGRGG